MSAQFFSSLADNALFVTAVELLKRSKAPEWQLTALVPMFAFFYVLLAPFVGAFADAFPKGKVMFLANSIKVIGCLLMLLGLHPLLAYGLVGLGAAAYSPAKYGILTELLPPYQLVKANGWIEGLTIISIILGVVLGGQLMGQHIAPLLLSIDIPHFETGIDSPPEAALAVIVAFYAIAALFNLYIPKTNAALQPFPKNLSILKQDFISCNIRLWTDKLGQISLATTTLFWGVSGNLRYIVLAWAAVALNYDTTQASSLVGVVAIGTAIGAVIASVRVQLDQATRVIPLGIAMGLLVLAMNLIHTLTIAVPFLIILGGLGGFLVVPMNALLQYRGHSLMGAGRSIAVQNFNEQASILLLGTLYSVLTIWAHLTAYQAISVFGLFVAITMWAIGRWNRYNETHYPAEMQQEYSEAHTPSNTH